METQPRCSGSPNDTPGVSSAQNRCTHPPRSVDLKMPPSRGHRAQDTVGSTGVLGCDMAYVSRYAHLSHRKGADVSHACGS